MTQIKALSADLQQVAIDELGEVVARIPQDLQNLKEWIEQQPHLKARTDDQFLVQFLRGCKYSLERAKEKIDRLYAMKTKFPELLDLTDVNERRFRELYNLGCYASLSKPLNGNGPRIFVIGYNFDASQYNIHEVFKVCNIMHEVMIIDDPYASINGVVYIVDMSKTTVGHMMQVTPGFVSKLLTYYEKSLPLRIKSVYFVNVPSVAQQLIKLILSFASAKLKERIQVCSKEDLKKLISPQYLPKDFGGENDSIDQRIQEYEKKFDEYQKYFQENAAFGTDESLRPGKPIDFDTMFGMGGSFRKLDVD